MLQSSRHRVPSLFGVGAVGYCVLFFFFNDTATTEIYTLSLHDALPILLESDRLCPPHRHPHHGRLAARLPRGRGARRGDRKSTRLNSSHVRISYAVFCLKKKKRKGKHRTRRQLAIHAPVVALCGAAEVL